MQTHRRIASILLLICGGLSMPAVASSLTVLTSFSESPIKAMVEGFRQRHPEVRLEVIYRRTLSAQRLLTQADGAPVDVVLSSSPTFFHSLDKAGLLARLPVRTQPPTWLSPHILGLDGKVAVVGYSGIGILYNRRYLAKHRLPVPTDWQSLADPAFMGHVMMSSPSQSGTTHMMVESILQQYGWRQGWAILMQIGGNLSAITARSFGVSDGISRGLAGAGLVIESYARTSQAHFDYIGFTPLHQGVILPTYLAVMQTSQQSALAARFIDFLLSAEGQAIVGTSEMAKVTLTEPGLAQQTEFVLDKELLYRRASLLKVLFDQTITQQLPALRLTWQGIDEAGANGEPRRAALIAQARTLASTPPLSEQQTQDPALLALFDDVYEGGKASPQAERAQQRWRQMTQDNLKAAMALVEQAAQP
ncbi:ABC transporter substrate-binding protein [Aeromonas bivalvium]|uniref:ABC transporter substrate-binding protein n=1 Tax=Aeromonas bivalvium TaxID=440079 RepID=UPI001FD4403C|nr:ABC transporter substrate-binding protein [Aeromonas bivalvium]